jgi:transcriptional regulator with XRE-family HTH domain
MKGIKAILGANIKYYRKKLHLSQEHLAEKLEITPKHLSSIETGATFVSAELLEKFSRHLLVSASTLFYSAGEMSTDDSLLGKIDHIIDKECEKTSNMIKMQIRYLSAQ